VQINIAEAPNIYYKDARRITNDTEYRKLLASAYQYFVQKYYDKAIEIYKQVLSLLSYKEVEEFTKSKIFFLASDIHMKKVNMRRWYNYEILLVVILKII